jgi:SAM-dependent methyltransferase
LRRRSDLNREYEQPYLPRRPEDELELPRNAKLLGSITKKDYFRSATATAIRDVFPLLDRMKDQNLERMCDIGCGFGGVTRFIADYLSVSEVVGIDYDKDVASSVADQGLTFHLLDMNRDTIPYPDGYFDLVTSFGVLEHLVHFDNAIEEMNRILKEDGILFINIPNLGSWLQRAGFLLGYQPRDVEVSTKTVPGRMWFYSDQPFGHLHSLTYRAMIEYLDFNGFDIVASKGSRPIKDNEKWNAVARAADAILSRRVSLARRYNILAKKRGRHDASGSV